MQLASSVCFLYVLCLDLKHITQHLDEVKPEGVVIEAGAQLFVLQLACNAQHVL